MHAFVVDIWKQLLQVFSPVLRFASYERSFPVDLPSTIAHSSLWTDHTLKCSTGQISSLDLAAATQDDYTTVAGTGTTVAPWPYGGEALPVPLNKQVLQAYTDGTIPAEITMYGTVCRAEEVTGADMVRNAKPRSHDVAAAVTGGQGLLLNYYMYFPYSHSPEFESEGDWSGVSLLLRHQSDASTLVEEFPPVLTCYYRKTMPRPFRSSHCYVVGVKGFRRWDDVKCVPDPTVGTHTHPVVYVSLGRHNCYYEPWIRTVPLTSPWPLFSEDGIEEGKYTAGPAKGLEGGGMEDMHLPWYGHWVYVLLPDLLPLTECATGCTWPLHPASGSSSSQGSEEGQDETGSAGYNSDPVADLAVAGGSYPTAAAVADQASSKAVKVALRYVDQTPTQKRSGATRVPGAALQ